MTAATLDEIYSREWYEGDFAELQPEFNIVGAAIARTFPTFSKAVDVGCGPGMLLRALEARGWRGFGIDGSRHAIEYSRTLPVDVQCDAPPLIIQADVRQPFLEGLRGQFAPHIIICTEVLEHIEEQYADGLVAELCKPGVPLVVTAAPPGQDGHYHVNCRPPEYWQKKFARHGVILDEQKTEELRRRWSSLERLSHMRRNVMVLT